VTEVESASPVAEATRNWKRFPNVVVSRQANPPDVPAPAMSFVIPIDSGFTHAAIEKATSPLARSALFARVKYCDEPVSRSATFG
jgi:hypothetical protein